MSIKVTIEHKTHYRFDKRVKLSPHTVRLRPAPHTRTPIEAYSLKVEPGGHFLNWQQDPFGNYLARLVFPEKAGYLNIEVEVIADMTVINPFDFFLEEAVEHYPFRYDGQLRSELSPYLRSVEDGDLLNDFVAQIDVTEKAKIKTIDFLVDLNQRVQRAVNYTIRMEPGVQSCEQTLELKSGSCRDSSYLLTQILRKLGLGARFVSGYLVQLRADIKPNEGPSGPESDFTDLHAWCEVYIPGAGWLGLDPTSGLFAGEGHIPLAAAPEPISAAPVTGFTDPCKVEMSHHNRVVRLPEIARVTKPYSDIEWQQIIDLGDRVDTILNEHDARLTMGGEPTFVSKDDMESPEWSTEAHGEQKYALSMQLLARLQERFAPNGLVHFGQGKWYPGEPLPRWALSCYWRKDGQAVWKNQHLVADLSTHSLCDAEKGREFAALLAKHLRLDQSFLIPAYEDIYHELWQDGQLPETIEIDRDALKSGDKRLDLLKDFQSLGAQAGWVLPINWRSDIDGWASCHWPLKRSHLFLLPGDSPIGYRLPLDSLPWEKTDENEFETEVDPFSGLGPLRDFHHQEFRRSITAGEVFPDRQRVQLPLPDDHRTSQKDRTGKIIHTALCLEIRDDRLHIFMPPLTKLEHYLNLVAAIEKTAEFLQRPVRIEGYEPPKDPRIERFAITPDPGVIEVNIHPAKSWRELMENTQTLYDEAWRIGLSTEKFMLDGRHSGTGGGNHVTLGGVTAPDSPLLRRPSVLQSLITYWQHHPGLSYLFSGLFVGPTSQAPRIDEARHESLYELEIAFDQMPEGDSEEPWLVDRLLRHLLVDITGNTHRAEFCIDKLYSPDSVSGRLGLLEFRGFEMPPQARMSLVQMLFLRVLFCWFWRNPYRRPLIRWGTALHDRFMLPDIIWADLVNVIDEISRAGYSFKSVWLKPFFEFRFPLIGSLNISGITIELRAAVEPWSVLGEEVSQGGNARYVDSSVERLQVKVSGLFDSRYQITCNGRRIPLKKTAVPGVLIAGVRYRAWQPPSALHPKIGVHAPLVFDIIDRWNQRSIGGCTYHVAHPGGRNYERYPLNAYEAEARRISRFRIDGHSQGPIAVKNENDNLEYPYTLDLRRRINASDGTS